MSIDPRPWVYLYAAASLSFVAYVLWHFHG